MIKKIGWILLASLSIFSCNTANQILSTLPIPLTEYEVIAGLKEALTIGSQNAGSDLHEPDAFYSNNDIKILFPIEVAEVEKKLRSIGLGSEIDKMILTMNRAAEKAAIESVPVFADAVKNMSVADGMKILKGNNNEATLYLRSQTYDALSLAFKPIIKNALSDVGFFQVWQPVMNTYNQLPFITKVDPDMELYVTNKALDALFIFLANEELRIRKDPAARVTDLLKKVFG